MSQSFLGQKIKRAVERFAGKSEPKSVRVDRDDLRTTLNQCELEVREMHRLLKASPEIGRHRTSQPSCRY